MPVPIRVSAVLTVAPQQYGTILVVTRTGTASARREHTPGRRRRVDRAHRQQAQRSATEAHLILAEDLLESDPREHPGGVDLIVVGNRGIDTLSGRQLDWVLSDLSPQAVLRRADRAHRGRADPGKSEGER